MREQQIEDILDFWFGPVPASSTYPEDKARMWFDEGEKHDHFIRSRFGEDYRLAAGGKLDSWAGTARGRLALILLLDQFSRHLYRNRPEAFKQDSKALALAEEGVSKKQDLELKPVERVFFYMPYEHAENLRVQEKSVELFKRLTENVPASIEFPIRHHLDYAIRHRDIIKRFGRFPHRNKILGRESLPEEESFLKEPDSSF